MDVYILMKGLFMLHLPGKAECHVDRRPFESFTVSSFRAIVSLVGYE